MVKMHFFHVHRIKSHNDAMNHTPATIVETLRTFYITFFILYITKAKFDELPPDDFEAKISSYVSETFLRIAFSDEKTASNALLMDMEFLKALSLSVTAEKSRTE